MVLFTIDQYLNIISYLSWILLIQILVCLGVTTINHFDYLYNKDNKIDNFNI
jgi:hypothetical protein